jgi:hypothetical protein
MNKAELILRELEKGNFNVLSELEIIKRATSDNPDCLETLYANYESLKNLAQSKLLEPTEASHPFANKTLQKGVKVRVEIPEVKTYKEALDALNSFIDRGSSKTHPEEQKRLNDAVAEARNLVDAYKLPYYGKKFTVYSISGDEIELDGVVDIKWNKNELLIL